MSMHNISEALAILDSIEDKGEDYYPRDFRPELSWEQFDVLWKALDDARHALAQAADLVVDGPAGDKEPQALPLPVPRVAAPAPPASAGGEGARLDHKEIARLGQVMSHALAERADGRAVFAIGGGALEFAVERVLAALAPAAQVNPGRDEIARIIARNIRVKARTVVGGSHNEPGDVWVEGFEEAAKAVVDAIEAARC